MVNADVTVALAFVDFLPLPPPGEVELEAVAATPASMLFELAFEALLLVAWFSEGEDWPPSAISVLELVDAGRTQSWAAFR